jgi:Na+-translocating ferredoxin:NAD+ oxidoreductase subunit B
MQDYKTLAEKIESILPQTQCTKCGFNGCKPYAQAIANGSANYNQCPPGGEQGVARIANILGMPVIKLNNEHGFERVRSVAVIDEKSCIGCTLCIQACPVDAIVGSAKHMHNVIEKDCTGCDLCIDPCPVDCITMLPVTTTTGWDAWSVDLANAAKHNYEHKIHRITLIKADNIQAETLQSAKNIVDNADDAAQKKIKQDIIAAAMQRAKSMNSNN